MISEKAKHIVLDVMDIKDSSIIYCGEIRILEIKPKYRWGILWKIYIFQKANKWKYKNDREYYIIYKIIS